MILLGIGLGGFVDGIFLHQVLQWHHLLSHEPCCSVATVTGLEKNTLADGLFHAGTWVAVLAGSLLVLRDWREDRRGPSKRLVAGGLLVGWGLFNLVEGLVNHQILGIHHVRDDLGSPLSWDLGFLGFAVLLIVAGWLLLRRDREPEPR
jgi:uncharacterized membrane protein